MKDKKKYILFIQTLVIGIIFGFILFYNLSRPRIMVLHSYANYVPEVAAFNKGFASIKDHRKTPYVVHSYMNISMAQTPEHARKISKKTRDFIQEFDPEIIVAVGEEAQHHVMRHYVDDPNIKVVFACIRDAQRYHYDRATNATGVLEQVPLDALKEILKKNYKRLLKEDKAPSLVFLSDQSFHAQVERAHILKQNWFPFRVDDFFQATSLEDWKQKVLSLQQGQSVLVVFEHHLLDKSNTLLQWTLKHSPVPVIAFMEKHFHQGAPICISSSAYESGEKAEHYVQALMNGAAPNDLSLSYTKQFMVGLRKDTTPQKLVLPKSFEVIARTNKRYVEGVT